MKRLALAPVLAIALLAGCRAAVPLAPPPASPPAVAWPAPLRGDAPGEATPDAAFRDRVPEPGPPVTFAPPKIDSFALKNGVRVLLVERHDLPLVSARVVARSGAGDLAMRPGSAAFLGAMIEQGTATRSALAISDAFAAMGAQHATWIDWDSGQITVEALATKTDAAIDLLADLAIHASFPQDDLDRLKARWAAALGAEKNNALSATGHATAAALYGRAHPYGHTLYGRADDVTKATRDELAKGYARELDPANVTIVVAGDVTRAALATKLEAAFGAWRSRGAAKRARLDAPKPTGARLVMVDRPGAPQAQVTVAAVGAPYATADRDALVVMNAILGGMFSSHVNLNLREAHGYTYDARSRFALRHGAGPFTVGGAVAAPATGAAVKELLAEIARMRDADVSAEELADAKEWLALGLPARFETLNDVTSALADLAVHDLPLDEYATWPARIAAVTAADVRRAAQAHLHPAKMKVVVVGDRAAVAPSLGALGLGAPEARDPFGDVVARP